MDSEDEFELPLRQRNQRVNYHVKKRTLSGPISEGTVLNICSFAKNQA